MPKHIRRKSQAKSERAAIKKLRSLGIIKRADLRRAPTPAQKRAIKKYADVISGRAKVLRPKNPGSYKKLFRVVGKNVIVPARKGEKVSVNKSGEIVRRRKVGGRKSTGTYKHAPRPDQFKPSKRRVVYALPVQRGGGELEWYRYSSWEKLVADMQTGSLKGYRNFADYVVEEELEPGERVHPRDEDEQEDRNAMLDARLETQLVRKRHQREFTAKFPEPSDDPFASKKK